MTAGLDAGSDLEPGETPPSSDSMSGTTGDDRRNAPNKGPVSGNRTPMIIALSALGIVVVMVALLAGASFFAA